MWELVPCTSRGIHDSVWAVVACMMPRAFARCQCCTKHIMRPQRRTTCFAGVAGYTWVGVLHTLLGFSFRATLLAANATSAAWLLAFHLLLKQPAGVSAPKMFPFGDT